jgi:hypothetical protein
MATHAVETTAQTSTRERLTGWKLFAGVTLLLVGAANLVNGYTAIEHSGYFTRHIVYSNLQFWGWTFVVWGGLQALAGIAILLRWGWGRPLGVVLAATSTVLWMFMIFAAPFAAFVSALLSIFVLVGLTTGENPFDR